MPPGPSWRRPSGWEFGSSTRTGCSGCWPARRRRSPRQTDGVRERWIAAALAAPYLVTVAALQGLTRTMPTFHGGDEANYHLPTIARFAADLPQPDLVHYPAAQTPLFHLLVAAVGKIAGMELWRLRLVTVLASYLAVLALWRLLRRHASLPTVPAAGLAALVGLSPYVFGNAFLLMT